MRGRRRTSEPSDSSASTTTCRPAPLRALTPSCGSEPPTTKVGSAPSSASTKAIMPLVVVLPCEPATAMPSPAATISASRSARWCSVRPSLRASTSSGSSDGTAPE